MLLQNSYRIISLLLVLPLPLNWFQNVSFSIGIVKWGKEEPLKNLG